MRVGRNDPCPCGSGQKYKKCHGAVIALLCSAGRDPDEKLLAWMREFASRTGAPFFYEQRGERFGFGPPAFQQEMLVKLERGEKLW